MNRVLKKEKTEKRTSVRYFEGMNLWIFGAVFVANIFFQLSEVSSSVFIYAGTLVLLGTLFFIDKDEYIYLSVSLITVLRFSTIFNVSVINIITFVYFFRTYVLENEYKSEKEKRRLSKAVVVPGVVFIIYSLQYILNGNLALRMSFIAIKLMFFLIYMVDVFRSMTDRESGERKFRHIQVYYVVGVLIAIFTSILINPAYSLDATRMSLSEDAGVNQLGISLAFCLVFVTLGMTKVENFKEWCVLAVTALPLLYYCFATQSRTCLVAMIITFASVMVFGYTQKRARLWITLMAIASVAVLGGMILFTEGSQIHENIMGTIERFTDPRGNDISNGRFELWQHYMNILTHNPRLFFFGGPLDEYGGIQAHNMFLEIISTFGVIGGIIVCWMYTAVFYEIRGAVVKLGKGKIRILGFLSLLIILVTGITSHTLLNTEPTVNFCLGVAMIYFYGEMNSDEDNVADDDDTGAGTYSKRKRYKNIRRLDRRYGKKLRRI